ncbi:MAG TPA: ATP-binding protein [Candidatus Limnocylindria bacterium]|nr:ATP-binding protein [Candidatus Limnocylindria bacterium]
MAERILIVDDEESVAVTMQAILEMDGYEVRSTTTAADAFATIQSSEPFDLVLSDLRLDDADGIQIIGEVRKRSPETIAIILTGYASLDSAVKAMREGAYDYLVKPCDVEELRMTVGRGLERRRLGQQLRERVRDLERANATIRELNLDLERRVAEATAELRDQYDKLQELDRLKSQFMSIASHELKTPVTAMSGFVQVALRRLRKRLDRGVPTAEEWKAEQAGVIEQLEVVRRQTGKLARLIDELLDVSRIQSGRVEFRLAEVDLAELAREVTERMQTTTSDHRIDVSVSGDAKVQADRDHLEQVLNNLVSNAIKYSPSGGAVGVALDGGSERVTLSVRDSGIGIPEPELDKVFGLFYRSPDRRARDVGGMGLGLYISKEIVDRHGGRIWAESAEGNGTTFHVELPRLAAVGHGEGSAKVAARA